MKHKSIYTLAYSPALFELLGKLGFKQKGSFDRKGYGLEVCSDGTYYLLSKKQASCRVSNNLSFMCKSIEELTKYAELIARDIFRIEKNKL